MTRTARPRRKRRPAIEFEDGLLFSELRRAAGGYRWHAAGDDFYLLPKDAVVTRDSRGVGLSWDEVAYSPLRAGRLIHREIGYLYGMGPSDALGDAMLAFANRYGPLGVERRPIPGLEPVSAEAVSDWIKVIKSVGRLVALWDTLGRPALHRDAELARMLDWRPSHAFAASVTICWHDQWPPGDPILVAGQGRRHLLDAWRALPPHLANVSAARFALADIINLQLHRSISPTLMPLRSLPTAVYDRREPLLGRLVPGNLMQLAYLQLYLELTGGVRPTQCAACGRWFDGTGRYSNARHCNDSCRKAAQRARRALKGKDQFPVTTTVTTAPVADQTAPGE